MLNTAQDVIRYAQTIVNQHFQSSPDFEHIKQQYAQDLLEFIKHTSELQSSLEVWSDKASRFQFINFMLYRMLRKINVTLAIEYDLNVPKGYIESAFRSFPQLLEQNKLSLPHLEHPGVVPQDLLIDMLCTYGLQQYRYPKWVDVVPGDVFLDCGSFLGETAMWALQKGAAQVHSFEPIPESFELIQKNVELNGYTNVCCYPYGLSDRKQKLIFKVPQHKQTSAFVESTQHTAYQNYLLNKHQIADVECRLHQS